MKCVTVFIEERVSQTCCPKVVLPSPIQKKDKCFPIKGTVYIQQKTMDSIMNKILMVTIPILMNTQVESQVTWQHHDIITFYATLNNVARLRWSNHAHESNWR